MKKNPPDLEISKALLVKIVEHAQREHPWECCGILAGKEGRVSRVYPMKNLEKSPFSYLADPEGQLRAFQELEEAGLEVSSIYHSHLATPAYPSSRDVELAFYPDAIILIISLLDQKKPSICAFQVKDGKVEERGIKISF
jgi:proteasome lid subunit RPN8/RPN11